MTILTVGIDLAQNVLAVRGVNEAGRAELIRPVVVRDKLHELIAACFVLQAQVTPCGRDCQLTDARGS
jgi:hypothetical protein